MDDRDDIQSSQGNVFPDKDGEIGDNPGSRIQCEAGDPSEAVWEEPEFPEQERQVLKFQVQQAPERLAEPV